MQTPIQQTAKPFITGKQLKQIVISLPELRADEIAGIFNQVLPKYGLNTPDIFHEFIAQLAHESGAFTAKTENLNYSAQGLANIWKNRYAVDPKAKVLVPNALANKLARKPEAIANNAYASRNGNGNEASGDGWRFRGGGYIQLTGRQIYTDYGKSIGKTAEEVAELVRTQEFYAIDSACWYFAKYKSLNDEAERDEFLKITKVVNGGTNGLEDREKYYDRAKKVII